MKVLGQTNFLLIASKLDSKNNKDKLSKLPRSDSLAKKMFLFFSSQTQQGFFSTSGIFLPNTELISVLGLTDDAARILQDSSLLFSSGTNHLMVEEPPAVDSTLLKFNAILLPIK